MSPIQAQGPAAPGEEEEEQQAIDQGQLALVHHREERHPQVQFPVELEVRHRHGPAGQEGGRPSVPAQGHGQTAGELDQPAEPHLSREGHPGPAQQPEQLLGAVAGQAQAGNHAQQGVGEILEAGGGVGHGDRPPADREGNPPLAGRSERAGGGGWRLDLCGLQYPPLRPGFHGGMRPRRQGWNTPGQRVPHRGQAPSGARLQAVRR